MKKYPIVIVTEEHDPHADQMVMLLSEMGHEPARVHTADIPLQTSLSLSYDGSSWGSTLQTRTRTIPLDDVRSVWWRHPAPVELPETLTPQEALFARSELHESVIGMWEMLKHSCYWVSYPGNIRTASYKISQLQEATRLGLQVPRSLVSNDPDRIRQFYETCDHQMIFKTLSVPIPRLLEVGFSVKEQWKNGNEEKARMIYTTLIREQDLALLDTIRLAPGMFEEYIPKKVELRVTVIGDEVFTAELHSQVNEETRYDWRHYEVDVPMYEHHLPVEIAEQCLALTRAYGLNFSTSDFIVTPDGRYVFLEMNPNGQWLWVQNCVPSLRMAEAMAACLIRGSNA